MPASFSRKVGSSAKIIGPTPIDKGGIVAYANVSPSYAGEVAFNYELDGDSQTVRFISYEQARKAAVMAIHSETHTFGHAEIYASSESERNHPLFTCAVSWMDCIKEQYTS